MPGRLKAVVQMQKKQGSKYQNQSLKWAFGAIHEECDKLSC